MSAIADRSARAGEVLERLPPGTIELGRRYLQAGNDLIEGSPEATHDDVEAHLLRPLHLVEDWPDPTDPLPVGTGAVHADLIDDDADALARLRVHLAGEVEGALDAERLAAEAQAWRLPVTPYRSLPHPLADNGQATSAERTSGLRSVQPSGPGSSVRDLTVLDLTALWAGPLATALLAQAGARVIKVNPSVRPDAFGRHLGLFSELNAAKEIVDLDLRQEGDRHSFELLVAGADLLIDSFSPRVMGNLGYGPDDLRRLNGGLSTMSITAFDRTAPEHDWVAYGPGVHAASGLAECEPEAGGSIRRRFRPAPIAYPDALAGMAAFAAAIDRLTTTETGPCDHIGISLAGAIAPLVTAATRGTTNVDDGRSCP